MYLKFLYACDFFILSIERIGHIVPLAKPQAAVAANSRLITGLRPATERRRYFVTTFLTGFAQT